MPNYRMAAGRPFAKPRGHYSALPNYRIAARRPFAEPQGHYSALPNSGFVFALFLEAIVASEALRPRHGRQWAVSSHRIAARRPFAKPQGHCSAMPNNGFVF